MNTSQLQFLQEKITDIRSALFSNDSDAVLKMPNSIIRVLEVDGSGQIWFFVSRPQQFLQEFDREFPAKLNFFQKGKPYFLHISGRAAIMSDPEEINHLVEFSEDVRQQAMSGQQVLVKLRIQKADYFERQSNNTVSGWSSMISKIFSWLFDFRPGMRTAYTVHDSAAA